MSAAAPLTAAAAAPSSSASAPDAAGTSVDPLTKAAMIVILQANDLKYEGETTTDEMIVKLKGILSRRTFVSHRNILTRFFRHCTSHNRSWRDCETVKDYIYSGISLSNWSAQYTRLITTVLNKYALFDAIDKPRYYEIKRKAYRVVSNKFDMQSFDDEQIVKMLRIVDGKAANDDLFLLIVVMAATGQRFVETKQLTVGAIGNLLRGHEETIMSAKTHNLDSVRMHGKFQASCGTSKEERLMLMPGGPCVGDACLHKIESGLEIKDGANKTIVLGDDDIAFFKHYESYRARFKPAKDGIVREGTGLKDRRKGLTRGSNFHALRRHYAVELDRRLNSVDVSPNMRTNIIAQGLRHTSLGSTQRYLKPSLNQVQQTLNAMY